MATRVIIGTRGGDVGMWVSKPGRSAYSATRSDFIIDTTTMPLRPVIAGTITSPVLDKDSSNFSAPTCSSISKVNAILSKNVSGTTVNGVGGAQYDSETGAPNKNGLAVYYKDYWFKNDHTPLIGSNIIPLMHISVGDPNVGTSSARVGDNYPKVYVYDNRIRLAVYQNWDAVADPSWYKIVYVDSYYPEYVELTDAFGNKALWWNPYVNNGVGPKAAAGTTYVKQMYVGPTPPTTLQTNCVIHYAVYNRAMSLP